MNEIEIGDAVAKAQADIEERLAALEAQTGRTVLSLALERIDITTIDDPDPCPVRAVIIDTTGPEPWNSQRRR